MFNSFTHPNRTLCSILEEMRDLDETKNYSGLLGLIEEAQSAGNKMEAALEDARDIREINAIRSEKKKELKQLKEELKLQEIKNENAILINKELLDEVLGDTFNEGYISGQISITLEDYNVILLKAKDKLNVFKKD